MTEKMITLKGEIVERLESYAQQQGLSIEEALMQLLSQHMRRQGLPSDYFSKLDAIQADDMIERPEQGEYEEREPLD